MSNFLYYLASFIIALFFILFGIISFFLPETEEGLRAVSHFLLQNTWLTYLCGFLFITIGIAILANIKLNIKKNYYHIKAGSHLTELDEKIFEQYLDTYWKELFPKLEVPSRAEIKKNKLYISAELPSIPLNEQKTLLQQIEKDLNEILIKYLGYHQEYIISINFKP
jgi:hypothetical protein